MSDVRCLWRPTDERFVQGNGAPRGASRTILDARRNLGEFLDGNLMRPLYFTDQDQTARVESALDTMTQAERIHIEIEMQSRAQTMYTSDYDPLR